MLLHPAFSPSWRGLLIGHADQFRRKFSELGGISCLPSTAIVPGRWAQSADMGRVITQWELLLVLGDAAFALLALGMLGRPERALTNKRA